LSLAGLSSKVSLLFSGEIGTNTSGEHLKGSLLGYAPALLSNIKLGWKGPTVRNILAYKKHKMFYKIEPRILF
jgi:hypothetical protein